jgi:hypothetical protein
MEPKKTYTEKDYFLALYFYNLEIILNQNDSGLSSVKFQSEESNTDEYLKKFFKPFILNNNNIQNIENEMCVFDIDGKKTSLTKNVFLNYRITDVLLPENLTQEQKLLISKQKKSVYTNPDLYLIISNGIEIWYESVELKSTKMNNIPGSSIQQVSPYEWVIFIKRTDTNVEVTIGHYINCITDRLPFPDRSPRPVIGYNPLKEWNLENRKLIGKDFYLKINTDEHIQKLKILEDWQDFLATNWMEILLKKSNKISEPWFNNAIRKFVIKIFDYTENMTSDEVGLFYQKIKKMIK